MATVLAVLTSGRRNGFTAQLLGSAIRGMESIEGVTADFLHTHQFRFGPCTSCFACIRNPEQACVLDDDMGRKGNGELFQRIGRANGLLIADPVHNWSPSASARLLIERTYPFLWNGGLHGMPAGSISCASNQGMQRLARADLCKWFFGHRMRYVGGVAAHVAFFDQALQEAEQLGRALAGAALADETEGRLHWNDANCYAFYAENAPWVALQAYLDNLTNGTMEPEKSILVQALNESVFKRPEAIEHVRSAQAELENTMRLYRAGEEVEAARSVAEAGAHWTRATWLEFLEQDVIGVKQPRTYRPIPGDE